MVSCGDDGIVVWCRMGMVELWLGRGDGGVMVGKVMMVEW